MAGNYFFSGRRSSEARKLASGWRDRQRARFQGMLALERLESRELLTSVTISANPSSTTEGSTPHGQFSFLRPTDDMGQSARTVSFSVGGTAINGTDYVTISSSVTIPAMQMGVSLDITATSDSLTEGAETVVLTLTGSDSGNATVTINDPSGGLPTLSIADASLSEGAARCSLP